MDEGIAYLFMSSTTSPWEFCPLGPAMAEDFVALADNIEEDMLR